MHVREGLTQNGELGHRCKMKIPKPKDFCYQNWLQVCVLMMSPKRKDHGADLHTSTRGQVSYNLCSTQFWRQTMSTRMGSLSRTNLRPNQYSTKNRWLGPWSPCLSLSTPSTSQAVTTKQHPFQGSKGTWSWNSYRPQRPCRRLDWWHLCTGTWYSLYRQHEALRVSPPTGNSCSSLPKTQEGTNSLRGNADTYKWHRPSICLHV